MKKTEHIFHKIGSGCRKCLKSLKYFGVFIATLGLKSIYFFIKVMTNPTKRIVFISRQDNKVSLDYELVMSALGRENAKLDIKVICCRLEKEKLMGLTKYMLISMYFLSTSKVCVVDSYWPTVSLLKHKKSLKIIQLWHSIGKIKKSGIAAVGRESGRDPVQAKLLKMHANYDYVIAGSKFFNKFYMASFGVDESKIKNYGLPRIDYINSKKYIIRDRFFSEFPYLKNKKIVLYAPTFRTYEYNGNPFEEITAAARYCDDVLLLIRGHPVSKANVEEVYSDGRFRRFSTIDLLSVADYLITDYSAISLEAAAAGVKTFFWTYDYDEYDNKNGLNISLKDEVRSNLSKDINNIMDRIEKDNFDFDAFISFKNKYVYDDVGNSTSQICNLITDLVD